MQSNGRVFQHLTSNIPFPSLSFLHLTLSRAALSAVVMFALRLLCNSQPLTLNFLPELGSAHRARDAFPFCRQARKIIGQSGEIAIDRNGMAARCVGCRIFQRRG